MMVNISDKSMIFSIVIPVYNVEMYLEECLESIVNQIHLIDEKCEVLLVDDGSTDSSGAICDNYAILYPEIIKVYHNENQGLLMTRRFGYKRATGKYIINCDSDDLLEANMLNDIIKIIEKYNSPDMILFNYYILHASKKENGYTDVFTTNYDCYVSKENVLKEFILQHSVVSVCTKVFKRSCIEKDKDYSCMAKISNGEDTLQSIEFFNNAQTFVYLNKALYDYRVGTGMTRKFDSNYYFGFKTVLEYLEIQNDIWNLPYFEKLFAVKVLKTTARAITQSRYNDWLSKKEQKEFLKKIATDDMLQKNIRKLSNVKPFLQKKHALLLEMLYLRMYSPIIALLDLKNKLERKRSIK